MLVVSWLGNFMAAALFAALTEYTELCPTDFESGTGCGFLAAQVVKQKVSKDFGKTLVKGIMCNWMVCMGTHAISATSRLARRLLVCSLVLCVGPPVFCSRLPLEPGAGHGG